MSRRDVVVIVIRRIIDSRALVQISGRRGGQEFAIADDLRAAPLEWYEQGDYLDFTVNHRGCVMAFARVTFTRIGSDGVELLSVPTNESGEDPPSTRHLREGDSFTYTANVSEPWLD